MSDHLIVAVVAVISGGFAIPLGFLRDLSPLETYLAAVAGALIGMTFFIFVGSGPFRLAQWFMPIPIDWVSVGLWRRQIKNGKLPDPSTPPSAEESVES